VPTEGPAITTQFLNNLEESVSAHIRRVEKVLDATKFDQRLAEMVEQVRRRPGRPCEISVRAFVVALLVLGFDGREHLIRVVRLLNSLDRKTLKRLGVTRTTPVTRRQVENMNRIVILALEVKAQREGKSKWEMLDELSDLLLPATAHVGVVDTTSIAVDGTSIASWGTRRKGKRSGSNGKRIPTDPDARWRAKGENSWRRPVFGYEVTGAVTVPEIDGPNVPLAMLSMRFRPANTTPTLMALATVNAVAKHQGRLGDVLIDLEYTKRVDGADFLLPIRALGGEPVFDLMPNQRGARGTVRGAVIVDGQPFSPSLPRSLYLIPVPPVNATKEDRVDYQRKIAIRAQYALQTHGSRKRDGQQVYACPAAVGKVTCPLMTPRRPVKRGTLPVFYNPAVAVAGTVCANAYTTFPATDLPLSQRELYGSKDWFFSYSRRNRVEGFFGNTKNEASENLRRGSIRVRTGMKTGFLVLMILAATNLRLAMRWDVNGGAPARAKMGRPRKKTLLEYADVAMRAGFSNAPPVVA
jgi:hypothetical protein